MSQGGFMRILFDAEDDNLKEDENAIEGEDENYELAIMRY